MNSSSRSAIARCLSACMFVSSLAAAPLHAAEPPHPKLVVAIAVDQFSADVFTEYRPLYQAGLKRRPAARCFPKAIRATHRLKPAPATPPS